MSRQCVCGVSTMFPLCDGTHNKDGWQCAPRAQAHPKMGLLASSDLHNLAGRLAHRFGGHIVSVDGPKTHRLVIVTNGQNMDHLVATYQRMTFNDAIVLCVGIPAIAVADLFEGAAILELPDEPLDVMWAAAEAACLGEAQPTHSTHPPSVFVSHAVCDEATIFSAIQAMRTHFRRQVFVCADSIPAGTAWNTEIQTQLSHCGLFLFIVSAKANQSTYCAFEAGVASSMDKPIRLVSIDGSPPPSHLQHLHTIDIPRLQKRKPWLDTNAAILEAMLTASA